VVSRDNTVAETFSNSSTGYPYPHPGRPCLVLILFVVFVLFQITDFNRPPLRRVSGYHCQGPPRPRGLYEYLFAACLPWWSCFLYGASGCCW
jgi:hypothetical protein